VKNVSTWRIEQVSGVSANQIVVIRFGREILHKLLLKEWVKMKLRLFKAQKCAV